MTTRYWLEIWTEEKHYSKISRILGERPSSNPRSIVQARETTEEDEPRWDYPHILMDDLEPLLPMLEDCGVTPDKISLWVHANYQDPSLEFTLDPLAMMRLGDMGIKFCFTCWRGNEFGLLNEEHPRGGDRVVDIDDVWIEADQSETGFAYPAGKARAVVSFDDGTFWEGTFVSYTYLEAMIRGSQRSGEFLKGSYFWMEGMILIEVLGKKQIEKAIMDLLKRRQFEKAFKPIKGTFQKELEEQCQMLELVVLHGPDMTESLTDLFELPKHQIQQVPSMWKHVRQLPIHVPVAEGIQPVLNLLDLKQANLQDYGILKQDISINWISQYAGHCNLEFGYGLLRELGRRGITLNLDCREAEDFISRSVE
ncbi:hypothetical protein [Pontibacter sp. G13]|uniref:hypothetical protein n=1 Tax=Pontibacter sp. G13 TaxID=3074898 RepID=UPI00288BEB84|nr:hypothetical protein [Pontibacter sp. G13]WNJ16152.1 hypothetical protein RJD25_14915 [Pontibacter sp. G13]